MSDRNSDGEVERCVVLEWSYALLSAWSGLACLAALIEMFLRVSGHMLEGDGVTPPGDVAVRDCLAAPVSPPFLSEKRAALLEVSLRMSGQVLEEVGVLPSGGVAVRDCTDVPALSLASSGKTTERWAFVDADTSMRAEDSSHWFGGAGLPFCVLSGAMKVPGVAGLMGRGACVREGLLLHGVHKVAVQALLFLRSRLEDYKVSPEMVGVVVIAGWSDVKKQVLG